MPELPEVETIRRGLEPAVAGRTIVGVRFAEGGERLLQGVPGEVFIARICGRRVDRIDRRGKYLMFALDDGTYFVAHLRMTGRIEVVRAAPDQHQPPARAERPAGLVAECTSTYATGGATESDPVNDGRYFRAALLLDNGDELRWKDVRRFGTWNIVDDPAEVEERLGPEPLSLEFTPDVLGNILAGRHAPVKSVLLDQRRIAGLGNIYVDEGLFEAAIHPLRLAASIVPEECVRLHAALQSVLQRGLDNFGTTLRDFVNAYGQEGRNREHLQVYQRSGQPCSRCGSTIQRIVVGGRGTHFCPDCQTSPGRSS